MIEQIDKRIAALESELADLKRQKLTILQAQVAAIQASLAKGVAPSPAKTKASDGDGWPAEILAKASQGRKKSASTAKASDEGGWPAEILGMSSKGRKKRGRRPGKHVPDEQILPSIKKLVTAAGKEGISGRRVAEALGVFYPRVRALMDQHFRKAGERKWSRYFSK